jgi:hypothetical protein
MKPVVIIAIVAVAMIGVMVPSVFAQDNSEYEGTSHKYPKWTVNLGTWFVEQKISSKELSQALDNLIDRKIISSDITNIPLLKFKVTEELSIKGKDSASVQPYVIRGGDRLVGFFDFDPNSKTMIYEISRETDLPKMNEPEFKIEEFKPQSYSTTDKKLVFDTKMCKLHPDGESCQQGWMFLELWFGEYVLEINRNFILFSVSKEGSTYPVLTTETNTGMAFCNGNIMTKNQCDNFIVPIRDPNAPYFDSGNRDDHVYGDKPEWYETYFEPGGGYSKDMRFFECNLHAGNVDWALQIAQECAYSGQCDAKDRDKFVEANYC